MHWVHNNVAGNQVSITPGELFENYRVAWHTDRTRPQPVIMEAQFAWTARYKYLRNRISGFTTKGAKDPTYVRACMFKKNEETGIVEMKIKGSPRDPLWYGQRSVPDGPGFVCLNSIPLGRPDDKAPNKVKLTARALSSLDGEKVRKYCEDVERGPMHANLMEFARTLIVPSLGPLSVAELSAMPRDVVKKMRGYGTVEKIGEPDCKTFVVPFVRAPTRSQSWQQFWLAPSDNEDALVGRALPPNIPEVPQPQVKQTNSTLARRQSKPLAPTVAVKPKRGRATPTLKRKSVACDACDGEVWRRANE